MKIPKSFFLSDDTLGIAKALLGKTIYTQINQQLTSGMIVETEAYMGPHDAGSHAFNHRKTAKNATMYEEGGVLYMYICYGIHDMLNIVTGPKDSSHAILIRAIQPIDGLAVMQERRGNVALNRLTKGPGSVAKALGLNKSHDLESLSGDKIWIADTSIQIPEENIRTSARVGLSCAEPYYSIPWRYFIAKNVFVSRPNK